MKKNKGNKRYIELAVRLNAKLSRSQGKKWTTNTPLYVKNLLASANTEIQGEGILSVIEPFDGVFIRYVNKGGPQTETILYDGKNNTFLAGSADELEKRQRLRNEEWHNR